MNRNSEVKCVASKKCRATRQFKSCLWIALRCSLIRIRSCLHVQPVYCNLHGQYNKRTTLTELHGINFLILTLFVSNKLRKTVSLADTFARCTIMTGGKKSFSLIQMLSSVQNDQVCPKAPIYLSNYKTENMQIKLDQIFFSIAIVILKNMPIFKFFYVVMKRSVGNRTNRGGSIIKRAFHIIVNCGTSYGIIQASSPCPSIF